MRYKAYMTKANLYQIVMYNIRKGKPIPGKIVLLIIVMQTHFVMIAMPNPEIAISLIAICQKQDIRYFPKYFH